MRRSTVIANVSATRRGRSSIRKVRPRVERKIAHLMRRKHGGRRARVRGRERVKQDFALLAASINLARLAVLGIRIAPRVTAGS